MRADLMACPEQFADFAGRDLQAARLIEGHIEGRFQVPLRQPFGHLEVVVMPIVEAERDDGLCTVSFCHGRPLPKLADDGSNSAAYHSLICRHSLAMLWPRRVRDPLDTGIARGQADETLDSFPHSCGPRLHVSALSA